MILRRIAEHMKQQHWTGVFIELVIVVVGVFIGLQVSNWNQARQNRALEKQYLQRLHDDMQLSIKIEEFHIAHAHAEVQFEVNMLADVESCQLKGKERNRFAAGLAFFGHINPPALVRGTIDELRSTGRIGLLRDVHLRAKLARVVTNNIEATMVFRLIMARINPALYFMESRFVVKHPPDLDQLDSIIHHGMPDGSFDFDFPAMCKDPRTAANISTVRMATLFTAERDAVALKSFQGLLKIIDRDLSHMKRDG